MEILNFDKTQNLFESKEFKDLENIFHRNENNVKSLIPRYLKYEGGNKATNIGTITHANANRETRSYTPFCFFKNYLSPYNILYGDPLFCTDVGLNNKNVNKITLFTIRMINTQLKNTFEKIKKLKRKIEENFELNDRMSEISEIVLFNMNSKSHSKFDPKYSQLINEMEPIMGYKLFSTYKFIGICEDYQSNFNKLLESEQEAFINLTLHGSSLIRINNLSSLSIQSLVLKKVYIVYLYNLDLETLFLKLVIIDNINNYYIRENIVILSYIHLGNIVSRNVYKKSRILKGDSNVLNLNLLSMYLNIV